MQVIKHAWRQFNLYTTFLLENNKGRIYFEELGIKGVG
jgi:hypothetical protein